MFTHEPRLIKGAPPPLFDRFSSEDPTAGGGKADVPDLAVRRHHLPVSDLRRSVVKEVGWLLNTRHPQASANVALPPSVVNYGIPDLATVTAHNPDHRQDLGGILERAIEAFEPRLRQVRVSVEEGRGDGRRLYAQVQAHLVVGHVMEPVTFSIALEHESQEEER
jgi:type VI secretion system lysozyme-like protein